MLEKGNYSNEDWRPQGRLRAEYAIGQMAQLAGSLGVTADDFTIWHNFDELSDPVVLNIDPSEIGQFQVLFQINDIKGVGLSELTDKLNCIRSAVNADYEVHGINPYTSAVGIYHDIEDQYVMSVNIGFAFDPFTRYY